MTPTKTGLCCAYSSFPGPINGAEPAGQVLSPYTCPHTGPHLIHPKHLPQTDVSHPGSTGMSLRFSLWNSLCTGRDGEVRSFLREAEGMSHTFTHPLNGGKDFSSMTVSE